MNVARTYALILRLLKRQVPALHAHLFGALEAGGAGAVPEDVFGELVRTWGLKGCCAEGGDGGGGGGGGSERGDGKGEAKEGVELELELAKRIGDLVVFEGDAAVVRVVVAVVAWGRGGLYGGVGREGEVDGFVEFVRGVGKV